MPKKPSNSSTNPDPNSDKPTTDTTTQPTRPNKKSLADLAHKHKPLRYRLTQDSKSPSGVTHKKGTVFQMTAAQRAADPRPFEPVTD